jgi:hypothetical protein
MVKKVTKAQGKALLAAVLPRTFIGSIGAAARGVPRQQRGAQKPVPFVPPKGKRGRGR